MSCTCLSLLALSRGPSIISASIQHPAPLLPAAVLESGAFGNWSPPDYQALKAAGPVEYAALRAAATGNSGGTAASPAAAVLPKAPTAAATQQQALAAGARPHGEQAEGLPGTPLAARRSGSGELGDGEDTAAIAALHSPPPTPAQIRVETRVAEWLERELLPAINRQASSEGACIRGTPGVKGVLLACDMSAALGWQFSSWTLV